MPDGQDFTAARLCALGRPGPTMTPPERRSRSRVLIGVVLLFGLINVGGYLWYRFGGERLALTATEPSEPGGSDDTSLDGVALTQRNNALKALEAGDYGRAVSLLEAAKRLNPELSDIDKLLSVARGLDDTGTSADPSPSETSGDVAPPGSTEEAPPPSRIVRRSEATGFLLVSSVPDRLLVRVDGEPKDLTPARIPVTAGKHVVELYDGKVRKVRRTVAVRPGAVTIVSEELVGRERPKREKSPSRESVPRPTEAANPAAALSDRQRGPAEPDDLPVEGWAAPAGGPLAIVVHMPGPSVSSVERAIRDAVAEANVKVIAGALAGSGVADAVIAHPVGSSAGGAHAESVRGRRHGILAAVVRSFTVPERTHIDHGGGGGRPRRLGDQDSGKADFGPIAIASTATGAQGRGSRVDAAARDGPGGAGQRSRSRIVQAADRAKALRAPIRGAGGGVYAGQSAPAHRAIPASDWLSPRRVFWVWRVGSDEGKAGFRYTPNVRRPRSGRAVSAANSVSHQRHLDH